MASSMFTATGALLVLCVGSASAQSPSAGCGNTPPQLVGSSTTVTTNFGGTSRKYIIHVPSSYRNDEASPAVFSFHGWGETASFNERYMGFTSLSDTYNHIMIYPEGMSDYNRQTNNGWQSWNGAGTSTTLGGECTSSTSGYCYLSCASRPQGCGRCDWTTCYDDGEYIKQVLDSVEASYCVDTSRIYASGYSNGGTFTYEAGLALTSRFAAIVPGGGQPHVGHNDAPRTDTGGAVSVMDLHGTRDTVCPPNSTTSTDGWNYEPVDNVMKVWATANGCTGVSTLRKYDTNEDGQTQLYCVSFGSCPDGVSVVRCSYNLGHNWLGYNTDGGVGARVAFDFFRDHRKRSLAEIGVSSADVAVAVKKLQFEMYGAQYKNKTVSQI